MKADTLKLTQKCWQGYWVKWSSCK